MEKTSVIRPDLSSPGAYLISPLCTMSWSSVTSGKWPSWSVSKCSRSWRHRSQKPRVRPCEPLCGLLRGGAASLPWRGIQSLFRADFCGLPRLCGGRRKRQEKGIGAFLRQRRSRQPAVRTVYGGFQRSRKWRLLDNGFTKVGVIVPMVTGFAGFSACLMTIWRNYE